MERAATGSGGASGVWQTYDDAAANDAMVARIATTENCILTVGLFEGLFRRMVLVIGRGTESEKM